MKAATVAALAAALLAAPGSARACRCAPPTFEAAYAAADLVLFARVVARRPEGEGLRLSLAPLGEPYKGHFDAAAAFHTAADSAGCGITAGPGAALLVFAERDASAPGRWQVHSCNGTRAADAPGPAPFADVPARHIVAQLHARHAGSLLRQAVRRAPVANDKASTGLVGLVRLHERAETVVRRAPEAGAAAIAVLRGSAGLVTREIGYEEPAAVVYARASRADRADRADRAGGWLRVRLAATADSAAADEGFGWIVAPADEAFVPYEDLLPGRLTYLTASNLRYTWPEPGAGLPQRLPDAKPPGRHEWPAVVHEVRRFAGTLWLRVEVSDHSPCDGRPLRTIAAGWMPAYGADGEPAAWFYSRGC